MLYEEEKPPFEGCRECGAPVSGVHRICERCHDILSKENVEGNYQDLVDIFENSIDK